MLRPLALLITTAAFGDIIGDPTDYMSFNVWSQDEEGFYEANVSTAVYTEPEQQDVVGLPDGAMLVTLTIENEFTQQWQSKTSTSTLVKAHPKSHLL